MVRLPHPDTGIPVPVTDEQQAVIHFWMTGARKEGEADIAARLMSLAAYAYFEATSSTPDEAAKLCAIIMNVLADAQAEVAEPEEDLFASTSGNVA